MSGSENDAVPESPATWENVVVGRTEELLGKVTRDDELSEEGEERAEIAHEVRAEFHEDHEQAERDREQRDHDHEQHER
jgi:hypothetical protein